MKPLIDRVACEMMRHFFFVTLILLAVGTFSFPDQSTLPELTWRNIGPNRGGRSIAVAGSVLRPHEYYFGATGGGLWKTNDSGTTWVPVTDGQIRSSSVGSVAVAASDPDIVYIGMGEVQLRGNVMQGDGIYKSVDGGETWIHKGLVDTQAIGRIRVHPNNPNIVFVAALGHPAGPNLERGVFRSLDGGDSWKKVLYRDPSTGAVDLVLDPNNPDILYASMWQVYRNAYQLWSGGPGSGLWMSDDNGENWKELSKKRGFPDGVLGKIGIDVSPADSKRLYAVVEADNGGLYRSDDRGESWFRVNGSRDLWQRSFYFNRVVADPKDPDTVFVLNFLLFKSTDGGTTIKALRTPHADHHDLWIDPTDSKRMICANDGGGTVSVTGGLTWTPQRYSTAQMYHVTTTADVPYHVVGAQQDNTTAAVSSYHEAWHGNPRSFSGDAFYAVAGGENGYVATHPSKPNIFFAGATNTLTRYDRTTGETRDVQPFPRIVMGESSAEVPERWNWVYPIVITKSEPYTLYAASQYLWKSIDEGRTWTKISTDLTRGDIETMGPSGGPIVLDQDGPEIYATIFTIAPSDVAPYVIWVGSDDGLVHVTRNGGREWKNVTPVDMVANTRVSMIDASPHVPGTAIVAAKRNQMDDRTPYIWRTDNFGQSWKRIDSSIPSSDFVHVVREDTQRAGLLFVGTEHGVYISFNEGEVWHSLSLNLPDLQVADLVVEKRDLVIATHGRGFYVLDDIEPLRQFEFPIEKRLYRPSSAVRRLYPANFDFRLEALDKSASISVLDDKGTVVYKTVIEANTVGHARVSWGLRYPGATVFEGMVLESRSPVNGPLAPPGMYKVELTVDGEVWSEAFEVLKDPRHPELSEKELREQFEFASRVRDRISEANEAVIEIRELSNKLVGQEGIEQWLVQLKDIESELYQVKNQSPKDKIAYPIRLNDRLSGLLWNVQRADGRPNSGHYKVYQELVAELDIYLKKLDDLRRSLPIFN